MQNNIDYLYSQLNELNSKIGSTYAYIDNNNLSDTKINQLNLKCDYMIARANKIENKIKLLENQETEPKQEKNDSIYWTLTIIITIITIIIVLLAL